MYDCQELCIFWTMRMYGYVAVTKRHAISSQENGYKISKVVQFMTVITIKMVRVIMRVIIAITITVSSPHHQQMQV